jgi:C1A family cysteine protease
MDALPQDELQSLKSENLRLQKEIEELRAESAANDRSSGLRGVIERFRRENLKLRKSLFRRSKTEEEIAAWRVFEKARKMLTVWAALGGSVITVASYLGIREYTQRVVDQNMKSVTEDRINRVVQQKVIDMLEKERPKIEADAHQQVQQVVALIPVRGILSEALIATANKLPNTPIPDTSVTQIDYTDQMPKVRNQENAGSVVGFAAAAVLEYQIKKKLATDVTISPQFIYYQSRRLEGTTNCDCGAQISDAIKVMTTTGIVPESAWPYKDTEVTSKPPTGVATAKHYKVTFARQLSGLREIKSGLQYYGPIVAGVTLYASAQQSSLMKSGMIPMPKPDDQVWGGHAICIVGFDDGRRLIKFRNSWGEGWGDHGYGYLSYDYAEKNLSDIWAVTL